jgi:hypothetical protein
MDQGLRAGVLEGIGIRQWIISFKQLPLQVDFTNGLGNLPPDVIVQSDILSPENVPGAQDYPDAEFVQRVRDITQNGQPINYFFSGLGNEARLLGVTGAEDSPISLSALGSPSNFPNQYPLTFGKQMDPIEVPVGDFLPGMGVAGSFMMTGSVDAWGTVQVPAGSFEALRLHIQAQGEFSFSAQGDTVTLSETIDQYSWIAPRVGAIANIQQITINPVGGVALPTTIVSVLLLQDFSATGTAVESLSWGQFKAMEH